MRRGMRRAFDEELEFVFHLTALVRELPSEDRKMLMEEFLTEVADTLREALKLEMPGFSPPRRGRNAQP